MPAKDILFNQGNTACYDSSIQNIVFKWQHVYIDIRHDLRLMEAVDISFPAACFPRLPSL